MITTTGQDMFCSRTATFSDCLVYRYSLDIMWNPDLPLICFIGLNPSTADEMQDDPTVRRCRRFVERWGGGGLLMRNLFAFRSPDPRMMRKAPEPVGGRANDDAILDGHGRAVRTVAAWGANGIWLLRDSWVRSLVRPLFCLRRTDGGHPQHPLYLKKTLKPIPF